MSYARALDRYRLDPPDLTFVVMGKPHGQPRQNHGARIGKDGKAHSYNYAAKTTKGDPHPAHEWKVKIIIAAKTAFYDESGPSLGGATYSGPVRVDIEAYFPRPGNLNRALDSDGPILRPSTPDNDNIEKAVWDALSGVAYKDDRQIVVNSTIGAYCSKVGVDEFAQYAEPCTVVHLTWMGVK